jgi:hypothetical protein
MWYMDGMRYRYEESLLVLLLVRIRSLEVVINGQMPQSAVDERCPMAISPLSDALRLSISDGSFQQRRGTTDQALFDFYW